MNSHYFVFGVALLLQFLLINNSEGFKCYQCFSKGRGSHSACENPQMSSLKNCSCLWKTPSQQNHLNGSLYSRDTLCIGDLHYKQDWSGCFKAVGVGHSSGEKWISRGCTTDKKNSCGSFKWSKNDSFGESYGVTMCQCTGENCNKSQQLTIKWTPLVPFLTTITLILFFLSK